MTDADSPMTDQVTGFDCFLQRMRSRPSLAAPGLSKRAPTVTVTDINKKSKKYDIFRPLKPVFQILVFSGSGSDFIS